MEEIVINKSITLGEYLEHIKTTCNALTAAAWLLVALVCFAIVLSLFLNNKE